MIGEHLFSFPFCLVFGIVGGGLLRWEWYGFSFFWFVGLYRYLVWMTNLLGYYKRISDDLRRF